MSATSLGAFPRRAPVQSLVHSRLDHWARFACAPSEVNSIKFHEMSFASALRRRRMNPPELGWEQGASPSRGRALFEFEGLRSVRSWTIVRYWGARNETKLSRHRGL